MTTYATPLSIAALPKNFCSASKPPAEAPMPTTEKPSFARDAKSTGAAISSGSPEGVGKVVGSAMLSS